MAAEQTEATRRTRSPHRCCLSTPKVKTSWMTTTEISSLLLSANQNAAFYCCLFLRSKIWLRTKEYIKKKKKNAIFCGEKRKEMLYKHHSSWDGCQGNHAIIMTFLMELVNMLLRYERLWFKTMQHREVITYRKECECVWGERESEWVYTSYLNTDMSTCDTHTCFHDDVSCSGSDLTAYNCLHLPRKFLHQALHTHTQQNGVMGTVAVNRLQF